MARVILNPIFRSFSGRLGNIVLYPSHGLQFARRYVVPRNPDTAAQRSRRSLFADAVRKWQAMPEYERALWNKKAKGIRACGYNLFISSTMRAVTAQHLSEGDDGVTQGSSFDAPSLHIISHSVSPVSMVASSRYTAQSGRFSDRAMFRRAPLKTG